MGREGGKGGEGKLQGGKGKRIWREKFGPPKNVGITPPSMLQDIGV